MLNNEIPPTIGKTIDSPNNSHVKVQEPQSPVQKMQNSKLNEGSNANCKFSIPISNHMHPNDNKTAGHKNVYVMG